MLVEASFFLLPLWEKVARTKSAPDEGSFAAERNPSPVFASRVHPLPQGERGLFKAWIFPVLYQCLAELPSLMLGPRLHIGNKIGLAWPLISDINLFCYCQRIIYFDAEISDRAFNFGVAE